MRLMHTRLPSNRLRDLREQRSVRVIDVASACGVYPSTVARWEDGLIPQQHLPRVADLLGVSVPFLAGWVDEERAA